MAPAFTTTSLPRAVPVVVEVGRAGGAVDIIVKLGAEEPEPGAEEPELGAEEREVGSEELRGLPEELEVGPLGAEELEAGPELSVGEELEVEPELSAGAEGSSVSSVEGMYDDSF